MTVVEEMERRRFMTEDAADARSGWYLRNCARSSVSSTLLDTLWPLTVILTGYREDGPSCESCRARLPTNTATKDRTKSDRLLKLRDLLEPFEAPELTGDCLEQNVAFACEEFAL